MENIMEMLQNPLVAGLFGFCLCLIFTFFVMIRSWFSHRSLERENASLLRNHLKMYDTGSKTLTTELESLKKQNENLRITVANLKSKTDKADLLKFEAYCRAIRLMNVRAPGFAQAWESTLGEVELDMSNVDNGLIAWVRKITRSPSTIKSEQVIELPK